MKFYFISIIILFLASNNHFAQVFTPWADTVTTFTFGANTNFGQASEFFPDNVIGAPDTSARRTTGSANPNEICALGLDGTITLKFTDNIIVDGTGPDFTIFENAFLQQFGPSAGQIFVEPAKVEVSLNGIDYFLFPFDSLTLEGLAGLTPTNGDSLFTDPEVSGGDQFDLGVVGLDSAKYIRLTDVSNIILSDQNHPHFNFLINGFDLDAVVALNSRSILTRVNEEIITSNDNNSKISLSPNPVSKSSSGLLNVTVNSLLPEYKNIAIYNVLGERVLSRPAQLFSAAGSQIQFNLSRLSTGIYFLALTGKAEAQIKKFIIIK